MKRLTLVTLILASIFSLGNAAVSRAADDPGQALEIAPPMLTLTGDPGETINSSINIRDVSISPLVVTSQVNDFSADGENGIPKISLDTDEPNPYSIISWIQPLGQLRLESKQIKNLPLTIKIPADAAPGGYYGVVRFTAAAPESDTTSVTLSASLGTLVFLRVNGDAKEDIAIKEFSTTQNGTTSWLFEGSPINFAVRVNNTGNVYEQPVGQIAVKDMFGNQIANVNINLEKRVVLPGSVRKYEGTLDKTVIGDRMLFGYYTAKLVMTYGSGGQQVTTDLSFFVIPWKLILLIIGGLVGGFFLIRFGLKRYTDYVLSRSPRRRR